MCIFFKLVRLRVCIYFSNMMGMTEYFSKLLKLGVRTHIYFSKLLKLGVRTHIYFSKPLRLL